MTRTAVSLASVLAMAASIMSGRPAPALAAARWMSCRAVSTWRAMSATIHRSPWKWPIGRPNCSRSPA